MLNLFENIYEGMCHIPSTCCIKIFVSYNQSKKHFAFVRTIKLKLVVQQKCVYLVVLSVSTTRNATR